MCPKAAGTSINAEKMPAFLTEYRTLACHTTVSGVAK